VSQQQNRAFFDRGGRVQLSTEIEKNLVMTIECFFDSLLSIDNRRNGNIQKTIDLEYFG
jgi:hypothetical protein